MRQHIFFICLLSIIVSSISNAQSGNISKEPINISDEGGASLEFGKPATAKKINSVHSKTLLNFEKNFKNTANVTWYSVDEKGKTYLVFFTTDNNPSMALFQKKGSMLYAISHCAENDLPAENRKTIKSNYVDYRISYVKKVMSGGKTAWIANLVNENKLVIVKTIDGQLEEMENYDLPKD